MGNAYASNPGFLRNSSTYRSKDRLMIHRWFCPMRHFESSLHAAPLPLRRNISIVESPKQLRNNRLALRSTTTSRSLDRLRTALHSPIHGTQTAHGVKISEQVTFFQKSLIFHRYAIKKCGQFEQWKFQIWTSGQRRAVRLVKLGWTNFRKNKNI